MARVGQAKMQRAIRLFPHRIIWNGEQRIEISFPDQRGGVLLDELRLF